jgi:hypothetical protein
MTKSTPTFTTIVPVEEWSGGDIIIIIIATLVSSQSLRPVGATATIFTVRRRAGTGRVV